MSITRITRFKDPRQVWAKPTVSDQDERKPFRKLDCLLCSNHAEHTHYLDWNIRNKAKANRAVLCVSCFIALRRQDENSAVIELKIHQKIAQLFATSSKGKLTTQPQKSQRHEP